jgi:hypothetical protein
MARSGNGGWIFLEEPCDRGEGKRPVHQYEPRSPAFPRESYVDISNEADAEVAISDQVEKIRSQGFEIQRHTIGQFCALLASMQTPQYRTFSSLFYWRNTGEDDLQEPEVFCSDILIAPTSESVETLADEFNRSLQRAGIPTSRYRRSSIKLRLMRTVFGTRIDPKPLGNTLEMKILGGGSSKHQAVNQWAKVIDLINSTIATT